MARLPGRVQGVVVQIRIELLTISRLPGFVTGNFTHTWVEA